MAKHEERVAAGCVRAALWACAAPCDCPPGAEDPAPPVWSRLLLVLAHPQTQPCLHPGSRRYPGAGAGRPGQAAQSPSAGHRPLTETPLPPAGLASRPAAVFSPAPRTPATAFTLSRAFPSIRRRAHRRTVAYFCLCALPGLGSPGPSCLFQCPAHQRGSVSPQGLLPRAETGRSVGGPRERRGSGLSRSRSSTAGSGVGFHLSLPGRAWGCPVSFSLTGIWGDGT